MYGRVPRNDYSKMVLSFLIIVLVLLTSVFITQMLMSRIVGDDPNDPIIIDSFSSDAGDYITVGDKITFTIQARSTATTPVGATFKVVDTTEPPGEVVYQQITIIQPDSNVTLEGETQVEHAGENTYELQYETYVEDVTHDEIVVNAHTDSNYVTVNNKDELYVSYFHYNPQFRAGDKEAERRIMEDLMYNLLKMYDKYPEYQFTLEIQGWGIELMAEEYPNTFYLFKKLHDRGQLELVVTHYSDQLCIAYPEIDMRKSIELSDSILARYNLTRSRIFGVQEWQYSPAFHEIMDDYGYDVILTRTRTFSKYYDVKANDNFYHYGVYQTQAPHYIVFDRDVRIDNPGKDNDYRHDWMFHGDGERVNSDCNANYFEYLESKQKDYEEKLKDHDNSDKSKFITISQLVDNYLNRSLPVKQLQDIPCMTQGVNYLWLGEERASHELDVEVMTLRYQARTALLAAETAYSYYKSLGGTNTTIETIIEDMWRDLFLAEVSDSTGWEPREIEVDYSIDLANSIIVKADDIVDYTLDHLDIVGDVLINTRLNTVIKNITAPVASPATLPVSIESSNDFILLEEQYSQNIYRGTLELNTTITVPSEVHFNISSNGLKYTPMSQNILFNLDPFIGSTGELFLSNGYIHLGGNVSLIMTPTTRYAMMILGDDSVFLKEDNARSPVIYEFYVIIGTPEYGYTVANNLNVQPCVVSSDITRPVFA